MDNFKILLVEDNGLLRNIMRESLEISFPTIDVDESANGERALDQVDVCPPDLVLMDIQLPGENGLEVTRKIKTTHPDVSIIILTSCDTPEYRQVAFRYGADDFIDKNAFDELKLKNLVKSYLQ